MQFYLYIIALSVFDLAAVIAIKLWHLRHHPLYIVIGMASFAITALFMGLALKYEGIAIVNIIWVAISTILVTILGYYIFKEPIALRQFVGITVILLGLIIVQWPK